MSQVIVLNYDYQFLNFVDWQKAFGLIISKKAIIELEDDNNVIRTVNKVFKIPTVIRLLKMVNIIRHRNISFSKKNVMIRDNFTCAYCGKKYKGNRNNFLTIDHIIPKSKGGKTNWINCVTACKKCNNKKGNKYLDEINMKLRYDPQELSVYEFIQIKLNNNNIMNNIYSKLFN